MAVTWNPSDKHANIALSLGNLRATTDDASGSGYWGVRATGGKASGKWYFEIVCVLPWDFIRVGVATLSETLTFPGDSLEGWGYGASTGKKYHNTNASYGDTWTDGDVIGVAVDMDAGKIWFAKNNVWQASGDPAAGTNEAYSDLSGETVYPMAGPYGSNGDSIDVDARFGLPDFQYTPPSGFSAWDPLMVEVEAGVGLEAVVAVDTFSDAIEVGVGIQAQVAVQSINNVEVIAGLGVEAQVAVQGIYPAAITAGIGVAAEVEVMNWAQWLAIYGSRFTARYYFTLTGAPDGLADVVLPITSFQYRLRDNTPSYLQVVIPRISDAQDIADRSNGEMIVEMVYLVDGVEQQREQLARVDLENVRADKGTKRRSVTLSGHRTETWGAQIVTIQGVTYQSDYNGLIRVRTAMPDLWLRPGDTVNAGEETFVVGQVMTAMAEKTQWTEVVEAA